MPSEIQRCIRNLEHIRFWKGKEHRSFLLYLGMVVLKDFLPIEQYDNFLHLMCGVIICSCDTYKRYIPVARECFLDFIDEFMNIYGEDAAGSNIHCISHIVEDVSRFGNLCSISTYPFENCLRHLKLSIRQCNRPLEQIARRLAERTVNYSMQFKKTQEHSQIEFCKQQTAGSMKFKQIKFNNEVIFSSSKQGDRYFLTKQKDIVEMEYVEDTTNNANIFGYPIENKVDFFFKPFASSKLNIYRSNGEKGSVHCYNMKDIVCKMIPLIYRTDIVFVPLLHSFDTLSEI